VYDDYFDQAGPFSFASNNAPQKQQPTAKASPPPPKPPVIARHADVRAEATGPAGAKVGYAPAKVSGAKKVTYARRSGSVFPLGKSTVTITAKNKVATTRKTFTVNVVDTTPPTLSLPRTVSTIATGAAGATVTYGPLRASDQVDRSMAVACSQPSGGVFALGSTTVSCSTRDDHGNRANAQFVVSVPLLSEPLSSMQTNTTLNYDGSDLTGAMTAITISAPINPIGDAPTYSWQATSGSIVANGLSAVWTRDTDGFQSMPGTVTITVLNATGASKTLTIQFT
jgi:hypothetical protein